MFEDSLSTLKTSLLAEENDEPVEWIVPEENALLISSEEQKQASESINKDANGDVTSKTNVPMSKEEDNAADVMETTALTSSSETAETWDKGEQQPSQCRDWIFALLFVFQFFTVFSIGSIYIHELLQQNDKEVAHQNLNQGFSASSDKNYYSLFEAIVITPTLVATCTSVLLILVSFIVLTKMARSFITFTLYTSVAVSFVISIAALANGILFLGIMSFISAIFGLCYAIAVRHRVPFAAANLNAAVSSITSNHNLSGILIVTTFMGVVMFIYMILWTASLIQVINVTFTNCDDENNNDDCSMNIEHPIYILPWIFFLFWTQQTFQNILHTTTAGITSTWYFSPVDSTSTSFVSCFCPNSTVLNSLFRSTTTSLGSICFGSLCVAVLQTLDFVVQLLRNENDQQRDRSGGEALLLCCLDCILRLLQDMMEYFNKWAFVYVGVYGYPFIEAGKKVTTLFKQRGWTVIINDNLIRNALGLMSFVIALLSGVIPFIFVFVLKNGDVDKEEVQQWKLAIFSIGFSIGLIFSTTVMSIIDSAVCTILVCFAEAPHDLEVNHYTHSCRMREAWNEVYQIQF